MGSLESQDWDQNIFINLGRHPIQYAHKYMRYGIKIPVHGGSVLGWSIASRTYSWQKFYNYLGNRSKQILYTELGKFLLLNQNTLPDTSLDGSWGEDRLLKAFVQAKELSVMMTDNSLINGVGAVNSQGFGQVVDLTKTQEVAEKFQLMRMIKNECLESVGLAGNAVHESSPYQTATSIAQTQDVTITQLSYLFSRHYEIMRSMRETMIETALYLTSKGEYRELNYTTSDKQRVIFKLDIENTLLHDLAIYINNDLNDISNLEKVKQFVVSNNTMGADSIELSEMIHAKTSSELFGKLKVLADKKQKQVDDERKYQSDMQQKQINAQEKLKKAELDWQANQNELDRINVLKSAQTKAIGFGDGTPMEILDAEIKLQQLRLKDAELSRNIAMDEFKKSMAQTQHEDTLQSNDKKIMNSHEIKLSELELRKKEIEASQQRTNAMLSQSKTDNKKK
jgi:hypothetical protein